MIHVDKPRVFGLGLAVWWWLALIASTPQYLSMLSQRQGRGEFFNSHGDPLLGIGLLGLMAMAVWFVVACSIVIWRRALPESGLQRAYLTVPILATALFWLS